MEEKIIKVTIQLIFQYGFRKFTMDDVSEALGISKKTIYKYFSSKQQLINEAVDYYIEGDRERTLQAMEKETGIDKLKAIVNSVNAVPTWIFRELKHLYPDVWNKMQELHKFKSELFYQLLLAGAQNGEINPEIEIEVVAPILQEIMDNFFSMEFMVKHDVTMVQLINNCSEVFLNGILKRDRG